MVKTKLTAILKKKMSKTSTKKETEKKDLFYFAPNGALYRVPDDAEETDAIEFTRPDGTKSYALHYTAVKVYAFQLNGKDNKPFTKVVSEDEIVSKIEDAKYYASPKDQSKLFKIPDNTPLVSAVRVTCRDGKQFYTFEFEMKKVFVFTLPGKDGKDFTKIVPADELYTIAKA